MPDKPGIPRKQRLAARGIGPKPPQTRAERLQRHFDAYEKRQEFLLNATDQEREQEIERLRPEYRGDPSWPDIERGIRFGGKEWQIALTEDWLTDFDAWEPGNEDGWKKLIDGLALQVENWLDQNSTLVNHIAQFKNLFAWELGKILAFRKYGLSNDSFSSVLLNHLFTVKPKGFKALIDKEGQGEAYLLAHNSLEQTQEGLAKKAAWELMANCYKLEAYIWTVFQNAIFKVLKKNKRDPHTYFADSDSIDALLMKATPDQKTFDTSPENQFLSLDEEIRNNELPQRLLRYIPELHLKNVLMLKHGFELTDREIANRLQKSDRMIRIYKNQLDKRIKDFKKSLK